MHVYRYMHQGSLHAYMSGDVARVFIYVRKSGDVGSLHACSSTKKIDLRYFFN